MEPGIDSSKKKDITTNCKTLSKILILFNFNQEIDFVDYFSINFSWLVGDKINVK